MPTPDPVEEGKYWYSFNHGPVHYLHYSTELDYSAGSEQNECALRPAAVVLLLCLDATVLHGFGQYSGEMLA